MARFVECLPFPAATVESKHESSRDQTQRCPVTVPGQLEDYVKAAHIEVPDQLARRPRAVEETETGRWLRGKKHSVIDQLKHDPPVDQSERAALPNVADD